MMLITGLEIIVAELMHKGKKVFVIPDEFQVRHTYNYPEWISERYQIRQITDYKMNLCFSKITGGSRKEKIVKINGARIYQVYLMMHQFMNSKSPFKLFPRQKLIANKCGCSVKQVNTALKGLNRLGILYWQKRFSGVNNYFWVVDIETYEAVQKLQQNEPTTSQDSNTTLLASIQDNIDETSSRSNQSLPDTEQSNHRKNHKNITKSELQHHAKGCLGTADFEKFKNHIQFKPSTDISYLAKQNKNDLVKCYRQICQELHIQIY